MNPTVEEMQIINGALVIATNVLYKESPRSQASQRLLNKIERVKKKSFGVWFDEAEANEKKAVVK